MKQTIIPFQNLKNLKNYEYTSSDLSITRTYVLNPYVYEPLIKYIPETVAPNVVTLAGFTFILLQVLICAIYAPTMTEMDVPRWVFAFSAICLFCYQTLDNLDGKQARKTNQCSPLGELFDHGVDALTCTLGAISWMTACAQGISSYTLIILFAPMLPFVFCTWEEYYVGGLNLGYVNGPIEGLLFVQSGQWLCAIFGQQFMHQTIENLLNYIPGTGAIQQLLPEFVKNTTVHVALNTFTMGLVLLNLSSNLKTVFSKIKNTNERIYSLIELTPFYLFFICFAVMASYSSVVKENPYTFITAVTLLFGYMGSSITLRFLLKAPIVINHKIMHLFVINALAAYMGVKKHIQLALLQLMTIVVILLYSYFVYVITNTISSYLNIGILRILPKKQD